MKVQVLAHKGYDDFQGEELMRALSVDGRELVVVGYGWEGKRDFMLADADKVIRLEEEGE